MRVALVHEFLTQLGGAERVLQCFHEIFPQAPVYTLVYDEKRTRGAFAGWDVRTSFLQKLPGGVKHYKWYLPLMPRAMERLDLSGYDLVLSDSSAFAKGVTTRLPARHICYCHTPTRYLWESMDEYVASTKYPALLRRLAKAYLKYFLKDWDLRAAKRPDILIANSRTVQERIYKYYGRGSRVIYPPVDTDFFNRGDKGDKEYYLTASRLEPYKKIELVLDAFMQLGLPLKVAGDGTLGEELRIKNRESSIEFLGRVTDEELRELYCGAKAFVFPALEDAGIMVLESLSCGAPVIAFGAGGTAEFVRDGENGVLFERQTADDIKTAVKRFEALRFDGEKVRESALRFDKALFKEKISRVIQDSTSPLIPLQAWRGEGEVELSQ